MSLPYIPTFGPDNSTHDKPPPQDERTIPQSQRNPLGPKFTFNNVELSEDQVDTDSAASSRTDNRFINDDMENDQEDTIEDYEMAETPRTPGRSIVPTKTQNTKAMVGGSKDPNAAETGTLPRRKHNKKSSLGKLSASKLAVVGSVIEPGQEATGRWTREEHDAFLVGLKLYGKEWKKVAAQVRTRTVVQTRTHAQKYFQKLQKAINSGDVDLAEISGLDADEIAVVAESLGTTLNYKGSNKGHQSVSIRRAKKESQMPPEKSSEGIVPTISALHVEERRQQQDATQVMLSSKDASQQQHRKTSQPSLTQKNPSVQQQEFSVPEQRPVNLGTDRFGALVTISSDKILSTDKGCLVNSFTADHVKNFPPPSPAACGKRKLAELAVAKMLAGVMSSTASTGGGHSVAIDQLEQGR
jgi:SHAQKYF class myb-like DNA-binding protein